MACAAAATVLTGGACLPLMVAASATFVAGGVTVMNGTAEVVESATGYNYMRDGLYGGDKAFYEAQRNAYATASVVGTAVITAGSSAGGICFVAGTLVQTEDGVTPIEEIRPGIQVWAWDEETGKKTLKPVLETYISKTDKLVHVFVNGEEIVSTPTHPFYSPVKGWMEAVHLRAGDILVLVNGEYVVVEKVQHELLEAPINVYNFNVEGFHTYYVSGIGVLVHNTCRFTEDQDALIQLAKEAKRAGVSRNEADILWSWAEELGLGDLRSFHGPAIDGYLGGSQLHIKINGMHINILE